MFDPTYLLDHPVFVHGVNQTVFTRRVYEKRDILSKPGRQLAASTFDARSSFPIWRRRGSENWLANGMNLRARNAARKFDELTVFRS